MIAVYALSPKIKHNVPFSLTCGMPYLSRIAVPALGGSGFLAGIRHWLADRDARRRHVFRGRERFRQVDPAGMRRRTMRIRPAGAATGTTSWTPAIGLTVSNYPCRALEELLANSHYHRNHKEPEPVRIRTEPDALYIYNIGGPRPFHPYGRFNTGHIFPGRYRNSRLGDFLKELDLTEGYATGIKVVLDTLKANCSPETSFYTDEGRTWFRVKVPIHEAFLREKAACFT